jgi:hypothetical protein
MKSTDEVHKQDRDVFYLFVDCFFRMRAYPRTVSTHETEMSKATFPGFLLTYNWEGDALSTYLQLRTRGSSFIRLSL